MRTYTLYTIEEVVTAIQHAETFRLNYKITKSYEEWKMVVDYEDYL